MASLFVRTIGTVAGGEGAFLGVASLIVRSGSWSRLILMAGTVEGAVAALRIRVMLSSLKRLDGVLSVELVDICRSWYVFTVMGVEV